jgi:hypothetical protein
MSHAHKPYTPHEQNCMQNTSLYSLLVFQLCVWEVIVLHLLDGRGGWLFLRTGISMDFFTDTFSTIILVRSEPIFVNLLRSPGIDSQPDGPVRQPYLTYRPTKLHRLGELIPGLF